MKPERMSPKQKAVYEFLVSAMRNGDITPSVREICDGVGLRSTSTVQTHLDSLQKKGYIKRSPQKNRSIEIVGKRAFDDGGDFMRVPIIGHVAAGEPIFAEEYIEDYVALPSQYFSASDKYFLLRVRGDSMIDAGIHDRDLIVVRQQNTANNGDIVVALVDDEATVKRFYKERGHYRLQPENPDYEAIIVNEVSVLGLLAGLLRVY